MKPRSKETRLASRLLRAIVHPETKKTPEDGEIESSKAAANIAESLGEKISEGSKAAVARKLPESKITGDILGSKASEIIELNFPPASDPPGSSTSASPPSVIDNWPWIRWNIVTLCLYLVLATSVKRRVKPPQGFKR